MNDNIASFKLDYLTRLFHSIRNKRFESYVIHRIWHQLNDDGIQFLVQQYHALPDGKYALIDLYLPQINLAVEIDEVYHRNQIHEDQVRQDAIVNITGCNFIRISMTDRNAQIKSIETLHKDIEALVNFIKNSIANLGCEYERWDGDNKLRPDYYKQKRYFKVSDNDYLKNIDDVATIFSAHAKHRGYQRAAGFDIPNKQGWVVWCPSSQNKYWSNALSKDGRRIIECPRDSSKAPEHIKTYLTKGEHRVTFFRHKDYLGFNFYKFVGVFEIDEDETKTQNKCVWKLISNEYKLL